MGGIEWTEAHQREALRRCYEIAAELVGTDEFHLNARTIASDARMMCRTEIGYRDQLASGNLDAARIEREVRRVDALATGRLVRETEYVIKSGGYPQAWAPTLERAREKRGKGQGWSISRVTRIRKAT